MKIVILEGLPKTGKSTLVSYIKELNIEGVHCVEELILDTKELDQDSFMKNDIAKINKYNDGLIIIDKGLISTLSYNQMLDELNGNPSLNQVQEWFNKEGIPFYKRNDVYTLYLKTDKIRLREHNNKTPHGTIKNQKRIEQITLDNIKKYCKNYEIINYSYEQKGKIANEIINKYM